jgi:hypothetical protein
MNPILINILVQIVKQLVTGALFQFITNAVTKAAHSNQPGEQKRAAVFASVMNTGVFQQTASWAINLAIETAVAKLKVSK